VANAASEEHDTASFVAHQPRLGEYFDAISRAATARSGENLEWVGISAEVKSGSQQVVVRPTTRHDPIGEHWEERWALVKSVKILQPRQRLEAVQVLSALEV